MTLKNSVPMTDTEWTQIVKSNLQKYETDQEKAKQRLQAQRNKFKNDLNTQLSQKQESARKLQQQELSVVKAAQDAINRRAEMEQMRRTAKAGRYNSEVDLRKQYLEK